MVGRRWEGRACFARGASPPPFIFKNIVHHRPAIRPAGALNACWLTVGGRDMHTLHTEFHIIYHLRYDTRASDLIQRHPETSFHINSEPANLAA